MWAIYLCAALPVIIRSPYDWRSEESASPSPQGLASRHLVIAIGVVVVNANANVFLSVSRRGPPTCERADREARRVVLLSEASLRRQPLQHGEELSTVDLNESRERGGAIVSIVIRLLLDGSVVRRLVKGTSARGVVLT